MTEPKSYKKYPKVIMTQLYIDPDKVLKGAIGELEDCVVIGFEKEDGEIYLASSSANGPEILWLLEKAKEIVLMDQEEE